MSDYTHDAVWDGIICPALNLYFSGAAISIHINPWEQNQKIL